MSLLIHRLAATAILVFGALLGLFVVLPLSALAATTIVSLRAGKQGWREFAKGIRDTWL